MNKAKNKVSTYGTLKTSQTLTSVLPVRPKKGNGYLKTMLKISLNVLKYIPFKGHM